MSRKARAYSGLIQRNVLYTFDILNMPQPICQFLSLANNDPGSAILDFARWIYQASFEAVCAG